MENVCIFSHDQVTYQITAIDYSSFYRESAIARKMNNVCILSHNQVTYHITAIDYSYFYRQSAIWADTDIRFIVKIIVQSVRCQQANIKQVPLV